MIRFDTHAHSDNSPDSLHSIPFICENAAHRGLSVVTITDHCECNAYYEDKEFHNDYQRSIRQSYFETVKAKVAFANRIRVLTGIELGQPVQDLAAAEEAVSANPYDFVLASVHNIAGQPDFYFMNFDDPSTDIDGLLESYFDEVLAVVRWGRFDSLAHLTYPVRYITGVYHRAVDLTKFNGQIDEILSELAAAGKALEINTGGLRKEIGETSPALAQVARFKELGGKIVTIGSDAHRAQELGAGFETGVRLAKQAGFEQVAYYVEREPQFVAIDF